MGILSARFPDDIARGAEGGHGYWSTTIVDHQGGFETANLDWLQARGQWNVARALELTGKHEIARSHFYKARGAFHHFRFKDWHDFKCARTGIDKGRLTGASTTWQINKVYGTDEPDFEYIRPLFRIVAGTVSVWISGVLQVGYTVDNDTGIITGAMSEDAEVSCQFDVLCRYNVQRFAARLDYRLDESRSVIAWPDIDIVEVREEPA
jgi:uncharacterized protein (TIGR02217 family)